jgi:hypothetical protein
MRNTTFTLALMALALGGVPAGAQEGPAAEAMEARIWLDRGDDPILQRGDRVRIYYRVNYDSYVALFHIDTDGSVTLVYPRSPGEDDLVRADRDYTLLSPSSSYWYVDEYPGKGYFFMVASSQPLSFDDYGYSSYDHAWDLTQVGRSVYTDPYVAMDDHVAHLIPDWESVPYALDFTSYDVGEAHEYPRFMCYQCHGYRSYTSWDPYTYGCSAVRVVIWDDPYYYPSYRYQGTRVVLARSRYGVPRYQFKERGAGETWMPLVRTRQPPPRGVQYAEPGVAGGSRQGPPQTRSAVPRDGTRRVAPDQPSRPTTWRPVVPRDGSGGRSDPVPGRRGGSPGSVLEPPQSGQASPQSDRRGEPAAQPPITNERPTLQRRPTSILAPSRPAAGGRSGSAGSPDSRGSAMPRTSGGVGVPTPRSPRPSQGVVMPSSPSRREGSSGSSQGRAIPSRPTPSTARPATPPGRPALQPRPKSSSGGSRPAARPKTGGGGDRPAARPPSRTGGGGGSGRPAARPSRSGGGGARRASRPTRRGGGGGAPPRPSAHRRGGGG